MRNLPLTFDNSTYSQKKGEDFAKSCGLLMIYELYLDSVHGSGRSKVQRLDKSKFGFQNNPYHKVRSF